MSTALAIPATPTEHARRLVAAFLAGRNASTRRAYAADLADFRAYLGAVDASEAAALLLGRGPAEANALVLSYRSALVERGLSTATVNRRLAALRALVKMGRMIGAVVWTLEIPNLRAQQYRDTRGPGAAGVAALMAQASGRRDAKGARDVAILTLLHVQALRCCEVTRLDLDDVNLDAATAGVLGKGRTEKETLTLAPATVDALRRWVELRGLEVGPLFWNLDRAHARQRLSGVAVYNVVRGMGDAVGIRARPHGLRHAAITEALERTQGNVRIVQRFSRHRDMRTVLIYDDNRADLYGQVAAMIGGPAPVPVHAAAS